MCLRQACRNADRFDQIDQLVAVLLTGRLKLSFSSAYKRVECSRVRGHRRYDDCFIGYPEQRADPCLRVPHLGATVPWDSLITANASFEIGRLLASAMWKMPWRSSSRSSMTGLPAGSLAQAFDAELADFDVLQCGLVLALAGMP